MKSKNNYLTKSRFLAGQQCRRRLWLQVHGPREDFEESAIQRSGRMVGDIARKRFRGGVLVDQAPWEHAEAVERTNELMKDKSVSAIFEAAFEFGNLRVRVDVLERQSRGRWGLVEVKSASSLKEHYIDDVAFQALVLQNAKVPLGTIEVMHLNKRYRRAERGLNLGHLFMRSDVKEEVKERLGEVPDLLPELHAVLRKRNEPRTEPWFHCNSPVACEWFDRCSTHKPDDWIWYLPGLPAKKAEALREIGAERIRDIPAEFSLTPLQETVRKVHRSGRSIISADLAQSIALLGPPTRYLDFETFGPAVPPYPGLKPYEAIPFQWSLHRASKQGTLSHKEYLAHPGADPRREFLETLLEAVSTGDEPIAVYSGYEQQILWALAKIFPERSSKIEKVIGRLVDLLPIVRSSVYMRKFGGSFSIKSIAPALTKVRYTGLNVADGGEASALFEQMHAGDVPETQISKIRSNLLTYCRQDTLALAKVHARLRQLLH